MRKLVRIAAVAATVLCGPVAILFMAQTQPGLYTANTFCGGSASTPSTTLCSIRKLVTADLPAGQLPGTTTNDDALAGNVGEYLSSSVTPSGAKTLTSGSPSDITSLVLTPGDWDCRGNVVYTVNAGTTVTAWRAWVNNASATTPTNPAGGSITIIDHSGTVNVSPIIPVMASRWSVSPSATIYLTTSSTFAASTETAAGFLGCRRAR